MTRRIGIEAEINDQELAHLASDQPFILISNRRFPEIDELVLLQVIGDRIENFRFVGKLSTPVKADLTPFYFEPEQNNTGLSSYLLSNSHKLRSTVEHGFSAGLFINPAKGGFLGFPQNQQIKKLFKTIRKLAIPLIPVHLDYGDLSAIPKENVQADSSRPSIKVSVRIGQPIGSKEQASFNKNSRFRKYVQSKIYALGSALEIRPFYFSEEGNFSEIIPAPAEEEIENDIRQLKYHHLISSQGDFDVFLAPALDIPVVIKEIGRLREITFRAVGEGTGNSCDLDEYDLYYEQLFIWDRENKKIAGGYRMGRGEEIFNKYGVEGFYIHSLFKINEGFHPIMQQAVELGRSFIVEAYQRKRLPLFLLWRGILFFLLRNPQYRYLYGPLSISKYYSDVSKSIIVEFIKRNYYDSEMARFLQPRKPFQPVTTDIDIKVLLDQFDGNLSHLDNFIEDIEPNHFKIPILMKQYIKQNARFISFNLDPNFSDVLDGFMILDLKNVPYSTLEALKRES